MSSIRTLLALEWTLWILTGSVWAAQPPNFVVILADDLGYADVGFHGCKDIPTPHLDRLAAGGVRCAAGYVSHSFCSPTRAGLMTGRYQHRYGHEHNPPYAPDDATIGLPPSEMTIADMLSRRGYVTGLIGKWHLGAAPPFHPMRRGFHEFFGFLGGGHRYFPEAWTGTTEYTTPLERNGQPVRETEYLTTALGREASQFVERHAARPFFLYLAFNAPHTPMEAPADVIARFSHIADEKRRIYAAMVSVMDQEIGRVLDTLRRCGVESNTLVWFMSDNGGPTPANTASNQPLRGTKGTVYEGGIRVPFVVSWPGRLPAGKVYPHPVSSLDVAPTLAALAGAEWPADRPADGVNLIPYLTGEQSDPPHATLIWRQNGSLPWAVRLGRYKLVQADAQTAPELYDLEADVSEQNGLSAQRADEVRRAREIFENWQKAMSEPRWQGPKSRRTDARSPARQTRPMSRSAEPRANFPQ